MSAATYQLRKLLEKSSSAEEIVYGQPTVPDARHEYTDMMFFRNSISILVRAAINNVGSTRQKVSEAISKHNSIDMHEFVIDDDRARIYVDETLEDIKAYDACLEIIDNRIFELLESLQKTKSRDN